MYFKLFVLLVLLLLIFDELTSYTLKRAPGQSDRIFFICCHLKRMKIFLLSIRQSYELFMHTYFEDLAGVALV